MKRHGKKICSLVLSVAMAVTCVPWTTASVYGAEADSADRAAENNGSGIVKKSWESFSDTFAGQELDSSWRDLAGDVSWSEGSLKLSNNGGTVSSIKREIGNDDFTVETEWSDYTADTSGNHSVTIFRVSDGTENNLVEIQRFSNGELKLLVINEGSQKPFVTLSDFGADHGWFRISYNSEEQTVTADYKTEEEDEYIQLVGSGTKMSDFGNAHVAEFRAQKWGGNAPVTVSYNAFQGEYTQKAVYQTAETDEFDGDSLNGAWYGAAGEVMLDGGALKFVDTGNGISTVKRNIGNRDYSVETKWSGFTSDEKGAAILRTSLDSSEQNFVQLRRQGGGQLLFTVVEEGQASEASVPYEEDHGWFRIDYNHETQTFQAYYKVEDEDAYIKMKDGRRTVKDFTGRHTVELIVDNWGTGTTAAAFEQIQTAYNEKQDLKLQSDRMSIEIDETTGGVYQLSDPGDGYGTNYVMNPSVRPKFDVDDSRWVGDLKFTVSKDGSTGYAAMTSLSDDIRQVKRDGDTINVTYQGTAQHAAGIKDFELTESYRLSEDGDQLNWNIHIKNTSGSSLEIQDLGIPLLMNSWWSTSQQGIYEQNVARHSYVGKDGSYIYWQRPNGDGSFLVMIPQDGTSLEFKDKARYNEGPFAEVDPSWEGLVEYFIHSEAISKKRSGAYLPSSSLNLEVDQEQDYGFTFKFAENYSDLHEILYEAGIADTVSLPGMVIPQDTKATLAVRAKDGIREVVGVDGKNIMVTEKGAGRDGYEIYEIAFSELGANDVIVRYGDGKESVLQYYSIEPVEKLIDINTDFIVKNQQAKTDKGYDGAYLQWNMASGKKISWHDYPGGGWKEWMAGGSDDAGLSSAVYLSEKNVTSPDQGQIESLDYYLENYIWGYLQKQDTYEIYRWYDGKDDTPNDQGTWRSYNYIHVANTYYNMYQIASEYPGITKLDGDVYLMRAYNTLKAMFTYGMFDGHNYGNGGQGAYVFGAMGEMNLPEILDALKAEAHDSEYEWLKEKITAKMETLFGEEYPFASEMSIDTTGFETCYTLAKMFGNIEMADKVMKASLACRGMQPLWYYYGSDNRHMGESWWNLGYETQLGAWQQQDYLYTYADPADEEFDDMMRGTYGAYLAGWANINSGQISENTANYGAASWQYQSEKGTNGYSYIPSLDGWWAWSGESALGFWGGLKTASANVVEDDIVGLYGYGCDVEYTGGSYTITPKDGVRTRLTLYNENKFSAEIKKAKYQKAVIGGDLQDMTFSLEHVTDSTYSPELILKNLPAGEYQVTVDGQRMQEISSDGNGAAVKLNGLSAKDHEVKISVKRQAAAELTGLNLAVQMAQKLEAQQQKYQCFEKESWENVAAVLAEAIVLAGKADATQKEVDDCTMALMTACGQLEYGTQKYGLKAIIEGAEAILADEATLAGYKPESVEKVRETLAAAKIVCENEQATVEEVREVSAALMDAVTSLVKKDGRLDALILMAEQFLAQAEIYTEESIRNLEEALEKARETAADSQAGEQQINDAYDRLAGAITDLTRKGSKEELETAIAKAEKILEDQARYLASTISGLEGVLNQAKEVYGDPNADQDQVGSALKTLVNEILKARLLGDVDLNGIVDTEDSAEILRYQAEIKNLTEEQITVGDVNFDGSADSSDASRILQYTAEMIEYFQ